MYISVLFFFFKQKTAYEMRISDWSSDVCSSDLIIDGESVSAVDFISEHGDILDVTEADVDIAPEAADGFIEGEGGGAGDEHQRFDGAVDEFAGLAAMGFVPGLFHERELADRKIVG